MKKIINILLITFGACFCAAGSGGMIFYSIAMAKNMFVIFPPMYIAVISMLGIVIGLAFIFFVATEQKRKSAKNIIDLQNESVKKIQTQLGQVCPYCGATVDPNSCFCKNCGQNVTPKICVKCGQSNTSDSRFCKACGEKLKD
ncbi:MAG: zinc ribbon domain-containing protein [Clostridia bacterium]